MDLEPCFIQLNGILNYIGNSWETRSTKVALKFILDIIYDIFYFMSSIPLFVQNVYLFKILM